MSSSVNLLKYQKDFESTKKALVYDLSLSDNRDITAIICFGSGTSGKPKGVELSHHSIIASLACLRVSDLVFLSSESRSVFFAPICHIFGQCSLAFTLLADRTRKTKTLIPTGLQTPNFMTPYLAIYTMMMKQFVLEDFLRLSSAKRATTMGMSPTIALAMAKRPTLKDYDLSNVKHILCSGAALQETRLARRNTHFPPSRSRKQRTR